MNYEKQTFIDGKTILRAEHLEHIEDGIVALEEKINAKDEPEIVLVGGWADLPRVNGYISTDGSVVDHEYYKTTDFIPAVVGTDIEYTVQSIVGTCYVLAFYDADKNFLANASIKAEKEGAASSSRVAFSGTATVPNGVAYFRIMDFYYNNKLDGSFTFYQEISNEGSMSQWTGKRWFAFGTSITDTSYINAETGTPTGKYVPYLVEMSGLVVNNHGIAGGTIGKGGNYGGSANILKEIIDTDLSTADLITIEGFVNDFACATEIGELGDTGGTDTVDDTEKITICGALYRAVKHCLETAPNATVLLLTESTGREYTMTAGNSAGTTVNYVVSKKNYLDKYQKDYNDAIIEMGRFMGVRVIDAGSKSQINCFNPEYIVDQIHHTELGGKQYATVIWDELKNISPKSC